MRNHRVAEIEPVWWSDSRSAVLLIGVLGVAILFRAVYFLELLDSPFGRHPILDADYYFRWARDLAAGGFRPAADYSGNPLYPYFLGLLVRFLGSGPVLIRAGQQFLGVVTCLLVYHCGRKVFGARTGLLAALLYAVFPPVIFYEGWLLSASLEAFLMTGLLAVLLTADHRFRRGWFGSGILAGLLLLARPSLVPLGAAAWIYWGSRREKLGDRAARILLFAFGLLLPLLPFALQHAVHERGFTLVSPHGGENFYIGNNPEANGLGRMPDFARGIPELQRMDFREEASRRSGRELTPVQSSRFWFGQGLAFIRSHPLRFLKLFPVKIYLFLCGADFFDNYSLAFFRGFSPLSLPFSWRMLSALALTGLIAFRRRGRGGVLFRIFILTYVLSIALFFVTSRFRIPVVPLFCLAAAAGLVEISGDWLRRRWRSAAAGTALAVILFVLLRGPDFRPPLSATYTAAAEVFAREGEMDRAAEYLEKARGEAGRETLPVTFSTYRRHLSWAQVELKRGNEEEAERIIGRILEQVKERPGALHFEIANVWAEHLRYDKAAEHYRAAVSADPGDFRALGNLGLALKKQGKTGEAEEAFLAAVKINPGYAPARGNLGTLYLERGEWEKAAGEFQAALDIDPGGMAKLRAALSYCRRRLGRPDEEGGGEDLPALPDQFRTDR